MIEKLLIDAATKAGFQEQLEAGNIPDYAIVFINDSKEIYTKGKYYPCPYTKEELDNKFSECNSNIQDTIESLLGQANGIASLDSSGKVPSSQLPSYVDDVLEYNNRSGFPGTGESGKIYIAKDTNLTYRWSGSTYVEVSQSLALGETSSTAYAGNKGKQNADNIASLQTKTTNIDNYTVNGKKISTNPTISKGDVGLGNVNNTSDANKPISTATQNALNQKQNTLVSGTNIKTLNGQSLLGSGNLTADGPITIQNMNLMTVSQYNSIVGSLANNTYKSYLCADAAGNVKGGAVTLNTEFGKLIHSDDAMAVNLGDIMIIGKANNTGFVKILPLNDAKTKTDSFPGTYGLMVPNDKEKLDKCVTDIDQTCFRCYTGTFNTNNCLWYGYYMYCNLGRPAGSADGETYLLRVANIGVEDGAMLIHQTAWSSLDPSKCFYRIIKTTDRNVYEPPTTTYGEWQEGTGSSEPTEPVEGTLPNPIDMLTEGDYNLNNYTSNGVYYGNQKNPQVQYTNTPYGTSVYNFMLEVYDLNMAIHQIYHGCNSGGENGNGTYIRYYSGGSWTAWRKIARDVSFSSSQGTGNVIGTLTIDGVSTKLYAGSPTIPTATSSTLGLVKIGYPESGKNYPVELNSNGQMFVNVPWTDTKVTVDSTLSSSSTNPVQNKVINSALSSKANTSHTHTISQISDLHVNWDTYLKTNPKLINGAIKLESQSLNDLHGVEDCGFYYAGGSNTVTGKPSGVNNFSLLVLRTGDGVVSQVLFSATTDVFIRYNNSTSGAVSWTAWTELANKSDLSWSNISGKPGSFYTLPTASASTLGGVKVGAGLRITNGVLSATGGGTADSVDWSNIDNKPSSFTPSTHTHAASQVTGLTANRALISDASGHPAVSTVTNTELGYLDGVTSSIQTQLNGKAASSHTHNAFTGATSSAAGSTGFVPAPASGNQNKYLRGDGTWQTPPDTNTTYSIATASTAGLVKPVSVITKPAINGASTTSGKYYHVQMSGDGNMFVNVPWANTTYSLASTSNNGLLRQLNNNALHTLHGDGNWGYSIVSCSISSTEDTGTVNFRLNTNSDVTDTAMAYVVSTDESIQIPADKRIILTFADGTGLSTLERTTQAVTLSPGNEYLFVRSATVASRGMIIGLYSASVNSQNTWTAYQDFTSGAGNSGSDMRFKSEVENINSTLDDINKINVIKYIWEHPDEKDVKYTFGVNADELINLGGIYATMVHHRQDNYDTKWVEYDRFGVLAIKGLQELNKKLEDKCAKYEKIISVLADKCGVNIDEL